VVDKKLISDIANQVKTVLTKWLFQSQL